MKDIENREDIKKMINTFYQKVRKDDLLGPIFDEAIQDWEVHLPTMYDFWDSMLFGAGTYKGNPFAKHIPLSIDETHFAKWIEIFIQSIDNQFVGSKSEEAKQRANSIAQVFTYKLKLLKSST